MAPEVLVCGARVAPAESVPAAEDFATGRGAVCPLSPKVDVWALGMLLLEQALVSTSAALLSTWLLRLNTRLTPVYMIVNMALTKTCVIS